MRRKKRKEGPSWKREQTTTIPPPKKKKENSSDHIACIMLRFDLSESEILQMWLGGRDGRPVAAPLGSTHYLYYVYAPIISNGVPQCLMYKFAIY